MKASSIFLLRGAMWTTVAFGLGQLSRLITNVILARLLAPDLFGIMVIVYSIRTGVDLISDVGIGQNIVYNENAEKPEFYNTAWTLRLIRGVLLWVIFVAAAVPTAHFYEMPILATVLPVAGLSFVLGAFGSVAPFLLQKRMQFVRLNLFELFQEIFSSAAHIVLAYFIPTIWALVFGALVAGATRSASSYLVLPNVKHRFFIAKEYVWQIFSFGKWIFISSIIYFLSVNYDRLYYGKVAILGMVGVYGVARSLSDVVGALITRVGSYLVFPLVAASQNRSRNQLRASLTMNRFAILLVGATGIAVMTTISDFVIKILYDQRYQAAGWMLPIFFLGAWFSIVSSLNESTLLGFGKPLYGTVGNCFKFAWLLVGLPIGFAYFETLGVVVIIATSDLWRYIPIVVGQTRERFSFVGQDILATFALIGFVGLCEWLRWSLGFGTSFDHLPIVGR